LLQPASDSRNQSRNHPFSGLALTAQHWRLIRHQLKQTPKVNALSSHDLANISLAHSPATLNAALQKFDHMFGIETRIRAWSQSRCE
jgi:hypothetical protein